MSPTEEDGARHGQPKAKKQADDCGGGEQTVEVERIGFACPDEEGDANRDQGNADKQDQDENGLPEGPHFFSDHVLSGEGRSNLHPASPDVEQPFGAGADESPFVGPLQVETA